MPSYYDCGVCFVKSNRRAMERILGCSSGEESFLLRRLLFALTPGPVEFMSTFPSTSSKARVDKCVVHLGNLDGCEGYGKAEKYEWKSA